jgi:hypothetical protein
MSNYESANVRNTMSQTSLGSAAVAWIIGGVGTCCLTFIPFVSWASLCTGGLFLIGNIVSAVTGYMARQQIQKEGGSKQDEQWANIGMILGIVGAVLGIGLVCFAFGLTLFSFSEINSGLVTPVP